MTLSEELDKIISGNITFNYGFYDVSKNKIKSELLTLFERKMNEVVPEYPLSVCVSVAEVRIRRDVVTDMQQNIKKVLEGK